MIPGSEEFLEKEMATHSSNLAWEIPWTEEPRGATIQGVTKELDIMKQLNNSTTRNLDKTLICFVAMLIYLKQDNIVFTFF